MKQRRRVFFDVFKPQARRKARLFTLQIDLYSAIPEVVLSDANIELPLICRKLLQRKAKVFRFAGHRVDELNERVGILPAFPDRNAGNQRKDRLARRVDELEIPALEISLFRCVP